LFFAAITSPFNNLFDEDSVATFDVILQVAGLFQKFINLEENDGLMSQVMKEEGESVLHSFQKDKLPCRDGLLIEFILSYFEFIGDDLL
jgi:hypothetical protein